MQKKDSIWTVTAFKKIHQLATAIFGSSLSGFGYFWCRAVQNLFEEEEEEEEEGEDFLMSGSQAATAQAAADELFSATDSPDVSAASESSVWCL